MKVTRDGVKTWPVTGFVLGLVALGVLGLAYWSSVLDRERYFQSRNFRLIADLASQTSNLIDNRARIFRDSVGDPRVHELEDENSQGRPPWHDLAARLIRDTTGAESDLARAVIVSPGANADPPTAPELKNYRQVARGDGPNLQISWVPPFGSQPTVSMRVPASATLGSTFRPKLGTGAFDTLVLATPEGQVVYAVGRRASEMQATSVTAILPVPAGKERADVARFADTISEQRVEIAGVGYRMFAQPCCRTEPIDVGGGRAVSSGFVVIGLADTEAMRIASWTISPVLVLFGVAGVMAALVGWPFLKCALMGVQQRITRRDVVSLGTSSIFGLALATILLLSIAAYARLSADVTAQLDALADRIHEEFDAEVKRAANQARVMTEALRGANCVTEPAVKAARTGKGKYADPCWEITGRWSRRDGLPSHDEGYEGYLGFSLVDVDGFQRVKSAGTPANRRQVLVIERDYFLQTVDQRGIWQVEACPDGCFLESHWSWITGKPQVVLARPTGIAALPVATLAIPMRSVIDPVLPPGFEFAIVDQDGKVQFHSDSQRNVHENLLLETDRNARLQSLILAHGEGSLNTSYWGRPYRAHVRPTVVPGWSIVTLHDKQQTRPLVLEWTTAALSMQAIYTLGCIIAMLLVMWRGPSWLWPDPLRRPWYGSIAIVCVTALMFWTVVAVRYDVTTSALVGAAAPVAVWMIIYLLLATRPPGRVGKWSELYRDYRATGALLLIVSSMVPAAAFFALAYDVHVEAHIKQRQIALAQEVDRKEPCSAAQPAKTGFPQLARYDRVFYDSSLACATSRKEQEAGGTLRDLLHEKIDHLLPYYTSASIALRELMHRHSGDGTWSSRRPEPGRQAVTVQAREPSFQLAVDSPLPAFIGIRGLQGNAPAVLVTILALAMLPLVALGGAAIVGYLLRRVVLADVVEPAPKQFHLETAVGQHVLLVCQAPPKIAEELADVYVLPLTPIVDSPHASAAWRRARAAVSEVAPIQRVGIPDLDERADDAGLTRGRLALVEELMGERDQTVILLSRADVPTLAQRFSAAFKWDPDPERGAKFIARFTVVDWTKNPAKASSAGGLTWWGELKKVAVALYGEVVKRWQSIGVEHNWREELIFSEGRSHPVLFRIYTALKDTSEFEEASLTRDQILEEFEERAAPFYKRLWDDCDGDERVVLEHVARHGLASAASRRIVRRLLARGLLRKDPALRLMSQSFARFVLESERTREVVALEQQAEPSLWDRVRVPLGVTSVIAIAFLVVTQREAFDATLSMAVGVSAAVPTLVKLTNLLTHLGVRVQGEGKGNA